MPPHPAPQRLPALPVGEDQRVFRSTSSGVASSWLVRLALGSSLHSGYGLIGARVDSSSDQSDLEIHAGLMRLLSISERFAFVPSATLELARASKIEGTSSWRERECCSAAPGGFFGHAPPRDCP